MKTFGEKMRQLRLARKLPLRKVAAFLDVDTSILSKIERGTRSASKEQAIKTAEFFDLNKDEVLAEYFADQIAQMIYQESICSEILKVAEEKVEYLKNH